MSSPRLQTRCRLALNLSHIIFLEAEVELVDPAPCHRPSIKADLPQHTLRSPFFKKGERHSSQRALCITSTIPQHGQEASFPSWRVCQNHFKTDKKFYSIAFPNSFHSHISAYEPLPQTWHLWSHSNTTNTTGRSQEKMWNCIYKPFELPVLDRGEEFLFLCFTCALFICCQKTENDRKDKDLINNPSYLTLVWRHSVTALTYLVILFWGHAIQSASNDLLPYWFFLNIRCRSFKYSCNQIHISWGCLQLVCFFGTSCLLIREQLNLCRLQMCTIHSRQRRRKTSHTLNDMIWKCINAKDVLLKCGNYLNKNLNLKW